MQCYQLELFESNDTLDLIERKIEEYKDSSDKVRRGIHAKFNSIQSRCKDLETRLALLERYICKGKRLDSDFGF